MLNEYITQVDLLHELMQGVIMTTCINKWWSHCDLMWLVQTVYIIS